MSASKTTQIILCMAFMLMACGKKSTVKVMATDKASLRTIFVKGDPLTLLEGSTSTQNSFITPTNLDSFNNYSLVGMIQFTEREEIIKQQDVGHEVSEEAHPVKADELIFNFIQNGNDYIYANQAKNLKLIFELNNGKLDLTALQNQSVIYDLKTIHYSLKKNGNAFSILVKSDEETEGRILLAFFFVRKTDQIEISTSPWDQDETLEANICGAPSAKVESIYRDGIAMWDQALDHRLMVVTKALLTYPPFSDLNTHCIYTVNNYQTSHREDKMELGITFPVSDIFPGKFIDSDTFIWAKENKKLAGSLEESEQLKRVIGHEFGHFLGLDHPSSETQFGSIMSYGGVDYISNDDFEAVAQLYPLLR